MKVDYYKVEIKYTGNYSDYTDADFIANAHARVDRGTDPYDHTEELSEEEARKAIQGYIIDHVSPCNKLVNVMWASIPRTEADDTAEQIEFIDTKIQANHGYMSRPFGVNYALLVLEIAHDIAENVAPGKITPEVLEILTEDNYHTARQACEIVREILRKEDVINDLRNS